jgi:hypothetical protein
MNEHVRKMHVFNGNILLQFGFPESFPDIYLAEPQNLDRSLNSLPFDIENASHTRHTQSLDIGGNRWRFFETLSLGSDVDAWAPMLNIMDIGPAEDLTLVIDPFNSFLGDGLSKLDPFGESMAMGHNYGLF